MCVSASAGDVFRTCHLGLTHKFASDLYDIFRADSPSVAEQYVVYHNPTQRSILSLGSDFGA